MENTGFIKIHRKLLENCISLKPEYLSVWLHLLLLAQHKDRHFIWNNEKKVLKPGQLITGTKQLSKKTGISQITVYRILKYLENEKQIEKQSTSKFTLITVINWNYYQSNEMQNEKQMRSEEHTSELQSH